MIGSKDFSTYKVEEILLVELDMKANSEKGTE